MKNVNDMQEIVTFEKEILNLKKTGGENFLQIIGVKLGFDIVTFRWSPVQKNGL